MNILFIIHGLSNKAGTERVACNLANLFQEKLGYNITIVNRLTTREEVAFPINDEVNILKFGGSYFKFYLKLRCFLKRNIFDMIIVHNMGKLSFLCSSMFLPNLKLVSLEHASFISYPKWIIKLSKFWMSKFTSFIVLTNADRAHYLKYHDNVVKIDNISVYNVNIINNQYNILSKRIIAIGRLSYEKNFIALLSAWKKINLFNLEWNLEIYGDGEERNKLENFILDNNIINVSLLGTQSDLSNVYKNASFLVMSSRYEGLGLVLIEAQSFGLPLISFDCPYGPSEVIEHNKNGLLVENNNIDKLSEAILKLISSYEIRDKFSFYAKESAKKYTSDRILQQWIDKVFSKVEQ